jgi:hypothetical protein
MDKATEKEVWRRARAQCEYCQMPQALQPTPFQIDHIIARQHGGSDELSNLALSCFRCNIHKGPNIAGIDPDSKKLVRLFHPRLDHWTDHFSWNGAYLVGQTDIGGATAVVLAINHPDYISLRESLMREGVFPP